VDAHIGLGQAQSLLGQNEEAVAAFRQAAALRPDLVDVHLALGRVESLLGRNEAAAQAFNQAIKVRPDSVIAHRVLAQLFSSQRNFEQALASLHNALALEPDHVEDLLSYGNTLTQLGKQGEAVNTFRRVLALRPHLAAAHVNLGQALHASNPTGASEEAAACFRRAIELEPDTFAAHFGLGQLLLHQNQMAAAVASLTRAADIQPDMIDLTLADALVRAGRLADAIKRCERASRLQTMSAPDLVYLGAVSAYLGAFATAELCWTRALALQPDNLALHVNIWGQLLVAGRLDDSKRYYERNRHLQRKLAEGHPAAPGTRYLRSYWTRQIGHISQIDRYLKTGMLGWRAPQRTVVLAGPDRVANPCYLDHFCCLVEIITDPAQIRELTPQARNLEDYYSMASLFDGRTNLNLAAATALVQNQWEAEGRPPLLKLSESCRKRALECLQALGVPRDAWFVSLHVRDTGQAASDHLHGIRNADITTYEAAVRSIVARGGWVIRVGDATMKPMPAMDQVIDYAHSKHRSDWMDVFLCAACRFFIGTQSGLGHVPTTFGVPSVITNWMSHLTPPWGGQNLFIPKRFWSARENRYLTFGEIIQSGLGFAQLSLCFTRQGVRVEDNSPEDIKDVVEEMLDRFDGSTRYRDADKALEEEFNRLAKAQGVIVSSPIGRAYLRKYSKELLG
jgi:putative glycosyltransferase (TIGR04372 family)